MKKMIFMVFISFQAFSIEPPFLKGLVVKQKGFSSELEVMVDQLSKSKMITYKEAQEIADAARVSNVDLSKAPKSNALFLIKSEIYKSLLENSFLPQKSRLTLSSSLIKTLDAKLKKHRLIYGPFSKWIMDSIKTELSSYMADDFIDKYQSVSGNDIKARTRAMELERLAKYLGPWILEFLDRSPEEFNALTDLVAGASLKSLARKGFYFANFSDDYSSSFGEELFSVPSLKGPIESKAQESKDKGLKEIKADRLEKGKADVQELAPNSDDPSSAIDELLDSSHKAPSEVDKNSWKPR